MKITDKVNQLPNIPGCYLLKDQTGKILYIGKAKALKKRVSSYFKEPKSTKTHYLMTKVVDFDFMITETEAEALILENNLIKEHLPKYNIRLKDDKSYPYIGINEKNAYPKLQFLRRPQKKQGMKLFGPYPHGVGIGSVIRALNKLYKLRDCSDFEFKSRKTPCLVYQMGQCDAPCVDYISKEQYSEKIKEISKFLEGGREARKILLQLEKSMLQASQNEEFERASIIRDGLFELQNFVGKSSEQSVEKISTGKDLDIISYFEGENIVDLSIYIMRNGYLISQKSFHFTKENLFEDVESQIISLIWEYYEQNDDDLPSYIIMDLKPNSRKILVESFKIQLKKTIGFISTENNNYKSLVASAYEHAKQMAQIREMTQASEYKAMTHLGRILGLSEPPERLECYDIAVWQGRSPTASLIHFESGRLVKNKYRYYHLRERPEGNNDFAMMQEVFSRRIKKGDLPDVFIVDGGRGQVSCVLAVLKENHINVPVVGIAKSKVLTETIKFNKEVGHSEERLIIPGRKDSISLNKYPELYRVVTSMRDEAHRFSRKLHHKKEASRIFHSWVDEIKGFNEEDRKKILKIFPRFSELKNETIFSLIEKLGMTEKKVIKLLDFEQKKRS